MGLIISNTCNYLRFNVLLYKQRVKQKTLSVVLIQ